MHAGLHDCLVLPCLLLQLLLAWSLLVCLLACRALPHCLIWPCQALSCLALGAESGQEWLGKAVKKREKLAEQIRAEFGEGSSRVEDAIR